MGYRVYFYNGAVILKLAFQVEFHFE